MTQNTASALAPDEMPYPALTIAVFADGRCRQMAERLLHNGYRVLMFDDVAELLAVAADGCIDLAIVHVTTNAPDRRTLVPPLVEQCGVIVVTGQQGPDGETARVRALQVGADDVLPEPFGYIELLWRVQAVLRRSTQRSGPRVIGPLEVDSRRREARLRGRPVQLTPVEFQLLQALAHDPDAVQRRGELLKTVWRWPEADRARSRTLDLHASRLRRRLGRDGDLFVVAVRGIGYRLR